jgi:hypothetical protein
MNRTLVDGAIGIIEKFNEHVEAGRFDNAMACVGYVHDALAMHLFMACGMSEDEARALADELRES